MRMNRDPQCFIAQFGIFDRGITPCSGRLVAGHLIPQQTIRREVSSRREDLWNPAVWVWICGGLGMGNEGHHHEFDSAKTVRIPREHIPPETEAWAEEHGLSWYLSREYGERTA